MGNYKIKTIYHGNYMKNCKIEFKSIFVYLIEPIYDKYSNIEYKEGVYGLGDYSFPIKKYYLSKDNSFRGTRGTYLLGEKDANALLVPLSVSDIGWSNPTYFNIGLQVMDGLRCVYDTNKFKFLDINERKAFILKIDVVLMKMFRYPSYVIKPFMGKTLSVLNDFKKAWNKANKHEKETILTQTNLYLQSTLDEIQKLSEGEKNLLEMKKMDLNSQAALNGMKGLSRKDKKILKIDNQNHLEVKGFINDMELRNDLMSAYKKI